jgi:hypothetical protein
MNLHIIHLLLQAAHHRSSKYNVANGTETDNQDFAGHKEKQSFGKSKKSRRILKTFHCAFVSSRDS